MSAVAYGRRFFHRSTRTRVQGKTNWLIQQFSTSSSSSSSYSYSIVWRWTGRGGLVYYSTWEFEGGWTRGIDPPSARSSPVIACCTNGAGDFLIHVLPTLYNWLSLGGSIYRWLWEFKTQREIRNSNYCLANGHIAIDESFPNWLTGPVLIPSWNRKEPSLDYCNRVKEK